MAYFVKKLNHVPICDIKVRDHLGKNGRRFEATILGGFFLFHINVNFFLETVLEE